VCVYIHTYTYISFNANPTLIEVNGHVKPMAIPDKEEGDNLDIVQQTVPRVLR